MPTVPQHDEAQWACLMGWGGRIFLTEKTGTTTRNCGLEM